MKQLHSVLTNLMSFNIDYTYLNFTTRILSFVHHICLGLYLSVGWGVEGDIWKKQVTVWDLILIHVRPVTVFLFLFLQFLFSAYFPQFEKNKS
jgi:hypothetical protein